MGRRQLVVLCASAVACVAGCERKPDKATTQIDLLRMFPYTTAAQGAAHLDFKMPGTSRSLVQGWSLPVRLPSGETVVTATENRAAIQFTITQVADRRLTVRCRILPGMDDRLGPQPVAVVFNRHRLNRFAPQPGAFAEYVIAIPAHVQHVGLNTLQLESRVWRRPPRQQSRGDVAYERISLDRDDARADIPELEAKPDAQRALLLPHGTSAEFYMRIPSNARLRYTQAVAAGSADGRLVTRVQRENSVAEAVSQQAGAGSVDADLSAYGDAIVKLTMTPEGGATFAVTEAGITGVQPAPAAVQPQVSGAKRSNVLLYVVDTLRADHLGCYGYALPTSTHIDAFARDAIFFPDAWAQASWTRPATATLLTGVYPYTHRALTLTGVIDEKSATLAELLQRQGYATVGFVTNVNVMGRFGFQRGFDRYVYLPEDESRPGRHVPADELHRYLVSWLEEKRERPFFLYAHASDPHTPYVPPGDFANRLRPAQLVSSLMHEAMPLQRLINDPAAVTPDNLRYLVSLYDGEVAFVDEQFGRLIDELKRLHLYDDTLIVFTSDHGEEFYEHKGFEHGRSLYREQLAIPLIMRLPEGRRSAEQASTTARQIDVVPTILAQLGIALPKSLRGTDLLAADRPSPGAVYAQTSLHPQAVLDSVIDGGFKAIRKTTAAHEAVELYDLRSDAAERTDIAPQRPLLRGYLLQEVMQWRYDVPVVAQAAREEGTDLDAATIDRLRMLGYAP